MATPTDIGLKGKDFMVDKWAEFRAQSGFFQLKVLLVAFNVVALVATYVVFWPPAKDFRIEVKKAEVVFSTKIVVEVTNLQEDAEQDLVVAMLGVPQGKTTVKRWTYKIKTLKPLKTERIEQKLFRDSGGRFPPKNIDVLRVQLVRDGKKILEHNPNEEP